MKALVDERQQLLASIKDSLQIWYELFLGLLLRLLHQHLGVADDQIKRCAQGVNEARWQPVPGRVAGWNSRLSHDVGSSAETFSPLVNSASILASRRGNSTGLVS